MGLLDPFPSFFFFANPPQPHHQFGDFKTEPDSLPAYMFMPQQQSLHPDAAAPLSRKKRSSSFNSVVTSTSQLPPPPLIGAPFDGMSSLASRQLDPMLAHMQMQQQQQLQHPYVQQAMHQQMPPQLHDGQYAMDDSSGNASGGNPHGSSHQDMWSGDFHA